MRAHLFWWFLMLAVMVWYSTVTIYVTIRGVMDIRQMLRRLKDHSTSILRPDYSFAAFFRLPFAALGVAVALSAAANSSAYGGTR